jgi:hypothetical protein
VNLGPRIEAVIGELVGIPSMRMAASSHGRSIRLTSAHRAERSLESLKTCKLQCGPVAGSGYPFATPNERAVAGRQPVAAASRDELTDWILGKTSRLKVDVMSRSRTLARPSGAAPTVHAGKRRCVRARSSQAAALVRSVS